jgi:hypothetical protein
MESHFLQAVEGRSMVPLGLRERLFHSGGGAELGFWTPQPRQAGAPHPAWLEAL